jgi:hypothetical protein
MPSPQTATGFSSVQSDGFAIPRRKPMPAPITPHSVPQVAPTPRSPRSRRSTFLTVTHLLPLLAAARAAGITSAPIILVTSA